MEQFNSSEMPPVVTVSWVLQYFSKFQLLELCEFLNFRLWTKLNQNVFAFFAVMDKEVKLHNREEIKTISLLLFLKITSWFVCQFFHFQQPLSFQFWGCLIVQQCPKVPTVLSAWGKSCATVCVSILVENCRQTISNSCKFLLNMPRFPEENEKGVFVFSKQLLFTDLSDCIFSYLRLSRSPMA